MYRHPPARICRGSKAGHNANFNCVSFNLTERGWTCLYCDLVIGRAPDDPLPHDKSQNEHECNVWYRNRFARLAEWERRAALGLEMEDWHIGWEPTPLPEHVKAMAMAKAAVMSSSKRAVAHQVLVPELASHSPSPSAATAHANNMLLIESTMAMRMAQLRAHFYPPPLPETFACPTTPTRVPVDLVEFLSTPAKLALDIALPPQNEDIELVEECALAPQVQEHPVPPLHPNPTLTFEPTVPMAPSSPTVDSPMEVEHVIQVSSDPVEVDVPPEADSEAAAAPAAAPSSPHVASPSLVGSPLSDVPDSPDLVVSALLPTDDAKPPQSPPQSPTSSAIAALLPSPGSPEKPPKKKAKKVHRAASTVPEVKMPRAPTATKVATPMRRNSKETVKETVMLKIPSRSQSLAAPAKTPKSKAAMLSSMGLTSKSVSPSTTPKSSAVAFPEADVAAPPPARPAPLKLWQSTKIPKKTAFVAPAPVVSASYVVSPLGSPPKPSARSRA